MRTLHPDFAAPAAGTTDARQFVRPLDARETASADAANEIQIHKLPGETPTRSTASASACITVSSATPPWAHHVYFNFLEVAGLHYSRRRLLGTERFRAILDHVRPRRGPAPRTARSTTASSISPVSTSGAQNVRCVTYCGELFGQYGFSRHWVNPRADLFVGAVPETVAMARTLGMPKDPRGGRRLPA